MEYKSDSESLSYKFETSINLKKFVIAITIIGIVVLLYFTIRFWLTINSAPECRDEALEAKAHFGDFIGGVIGTIFSLAGVIMLFLTLKKQQEDGVRSSFQNHFYEMLKFHRENVKEVEYRKFENGKENVFQSRKVFRTIYKEFEYVIEEIHNFLNANNVDEDFISVTFKEKVKKINLTKKLEIKPKELLILSFAYEVVFFGVSLNGEKILRSRFKDYMNNDLLNKLLYFLRLKPIESNESGFQRWKKFENNKSVDFINEFNSYYEHKSGNEIRMDMQPYSILNNIKLDKYYGGHQYRLGHYFRQLFQLYNFIVSSKTLNNDEKYEYGKVIRAQLSNFEQHLIFLNSISSLGRIWELESSHPNIQDDFMRNEMFNMITFFSIIKNIPYLETNYYSIKTYYPRIKFEVEL